MRHLPFASPAGPPGTRQRSINVSTGVQAMPCHDGLSAQAPSDKHRMLKGNGSGLRGAKIRFDPERQNRGGARQRTVEPPGTARPHARPGCGSGRPRGGHETGRPGATEPVVRWTARFAACLVTTHTRVMTTCRVLLGVFLQVIDGIAHGDELRRPHREFRRRILFAP
jgi:hypothetical protein